MQEDEHKQEDDEGGTKPKPGICCRHQLQAGGLEMLLPEQVKH